MNGIAASVALATALLLDPAPLRVNARLAALRPVSDAESRTGWDAGRVLPIVAGVALGALAAVFGGWPGGPLVAPLVAAAGWLLARKALAPGAARPSRTEPLQLAAGWDLLAACLDAGLPAPTAVRAVAANLPEGAARALGETAELIALGGDPVQAWAPALAHQDTAALALGARRTARSGTALAGVARALAEEVRAGAADLAEARAQRAGVLVSGPLGLCFLPAFLCLGVVPVVIGLAGELLDSW